MNVSDLYQKKLKICTTSYLQFIFQNKNMWHLKLRLLRNVHFHLNFKKRCWDICHKIKDQNAFKHFLIKGGVMRYMSKNVWLLILLHNQNLNGWNYLSLILIYIYSYDVFQVIVQNMFKHQVHLLSNHEKFSHLHGQVFILLYSFHLFHNCSVLYPPKQRAVLF